MASAPASSFIVFDNFLTLYFQSSPTVSKVTKQFKVLRIKEQETTLKVIGKDYTVFSIYRVYYTPTRAGIMSTVDSVH